MFRDISAHLTAHWQEFFPEQESCGNLYPLFTRGDKWNMIFIFSSHNPKPLAVIEIAQGKNELLRKSAENLIALNKMPSLEKFCPRFIYFGSLGENDMLIQEAYEGIPLLFLLEKRPARRSSIERGIFISTDLLIRIQSLTILKYVSLDSQGLNEFFSPLLDLADTFDDMRGLINSIKNKKMPLVLSHNDYIPSNILINRNELKILDWEYANFQGLPLTDLLNFLVWAYRDIKQKDRPIVSFIRETFCFRSSLGTVVKRALDRYCQALAIDKELALAIFLQWVYENFKDKELIGSLISRPKECFDIKSIE